MNLVPKICISIVYILIVTSIFLTIFVDIEFCGLIPMTVFTFCYLLWLEYPFKEEKDDIEG